MADPSGCARLIFALIVTFPIILLAGSPHAEQKQSVESLYRAGVAARAARDFDRAAILLERAARRDPRNADVLTQLGLVYSAQERLADAHRVLERATQLAPRNTDALLALARVRSWQGDFSGAQIDLARILRIEPRNRDAQVLDARLAMMRRDYPAAEQKFERLASSYPSDTEILLGLGDARAERGDSSGARDAYRTVIGIDPNNTVARERLAAIGGAVPSAAIDRWSLSQSYSISAFSRQRREPWHESFTQITHRPTASTALHARVEVSHRFRTTDTYVQGGVDHRISDALSAYAYLGGTPNSHFREEFAALGGGAVRLSKNADVIGPTLAILDGRYSRYVTGPVRTLAPGVQQYLWSGRVWITGKWINTWANDGKHRNGWFVRGDALVADRLRVFGGIADAPETSDNVTADTRSYFGGFQFDLGRSVVADIDYLHENRKNSYLRNAVTMTVTVRF